MMRMGADQALRSVLPKVIGIGGLDVSSDPSVSYTTVLGSCVAVCLWDARVQTGGISHFLLSTVSDLESTDFRYGSLALPALLDRMMTVGASTETLDAVVTGGANMVKSMMAIGTDNAAFAVDWLAEQKIKVSHCDVGGSAARRVRFVPSTGAYTINTVAERLS